MQELRQSKLPRSSSKMGCMLSLILVIFLLAGGGYAFLMTDDTSPRVHAVYLADLNGDERLDAFLVFLNGLHKVLLNDGVGNFRRDQELLMHNYVLALGDINGDEQIDAILSLYRDNEFFLACKTDMPGLFSENFLNTGSLQAFSIEDSNQDGIPEDFVAGCCTYNSTLINYGEFAYGSPCLGKGDARAVALADLNGDKALDAFLAKSWMDVDGERQRRIPNEIWFNDGQGNFYDSGQRLGQTESSSVVLVDVNNDGFADAVVGNRSPDEIWINDGLGNLSDSGQRLGGGLTRSIFLADLDGDHDLDLFADTAMSGRVWLNDGTGYFRRGQYIRFSLGHVVAVGDVTGDGMVDIFIANVGFYQVWLGEGNGRFTAGSRTDY